MPLPPPSCPFHDADEFKKLFWPAPSGLDVHLHDATGNSWRPRETDCQLSASGANCQIFLSCPSIHYVRMYVGACLSAKIHHDKGHLNQHQIHLWTKLLVPIYQFYPSNSFLSQWAKYFLLMSCFLTYWGVRRCSELGSDAYLIN